jgi:hypothetical protein
MAGAPDAPSPNIFGKPSAKRPKRSPAKAVKRYLNKYEALISKESEIKSVDNVKLSCILLSIYSLFDD